MRKLFGVALPALAGALAVVAAATGGSAQEPVSDPSALAMPAVRTSIASQRIYFVMTDRYANGSAANDRGGRTGGREVTGYDPTDPGWFHGGDFVGLTGDCTDTRRGLARLRSLGFTSIWVTPPFGQKYVQGDSAAYHGYWAVDLEHVDPHLGTDAEFGAFVECAHRLGMKVILDALVNHTADVIDLQPDRAYVSLGAVPYRDCNGNPFDPAAFAPSGTFPCLSPQTMPRRPVVTPEEQHVKRPAWLNDVTKYHDRGNISTSCDQECQEHGDFFGLDDLFTEQPEVMTGLADVYADWIRRYRLDGFRIDTARHVNRDFFRLWVPRILAAARDAGVPEFEIFGEVFVRDAVAVSEFVRDRGLPNVLDFPLQTPAVRFAAGRGSGGAIATRLADDDYFALPSGVVHTPPTFLGNHDIGRAALNVLAVGPRGGTVLQRVLLAYELLYFLRGAPVVYYGDEVGIIGTGGDRAARQDMFPTQVRDWRTDARVASPPIGTRSSFDVANHPIANRLRALSGLRTRYPVLSTGASIVRSTGRNTLAFSRVDTSDRREYLAVFNAGDRRVRLTIRTGTPSSAWSTLFGPRLRPRSGRTGALTIVLPARRSVLLRAARQIPTAPARTPRVTVGIDAASDLVRVAAALSGVPASVTFAGRRPGAPGWERIAADDSPPYRAFVRRGEFARVAAVVLGLDGSRAAQEADVPDALQTK